MKRPELLSDIQLQSLLEHVAEVGVGDAVLERSDSLRVGVGNGDDKVLAQLGSIYEVEALDSGDCFDNLDDGVFFVSKEVADLSMFTITKLAGVVGREASDFFDERGPVVGGPRNFVCFAAGVLDLERTLEVVSEYRGDAVEIGIILFPLEDFPDVCRCDTGARSDPRRSEVDAQRVRDRIHRYNSVCLCIIRKFCTGRSRASRK